MRTLLILLLLLVPLPAVAGALEDLRAWPVEVTEADEAAVERQVDAALAEHSLDEIVAALPTVPSPWVRFGLLQKALPGLVRERPERVLEAALAMDGPLLARTILAGAVLLAPESALAGSWVERGLAVSEPRLWYGDLDRLQALEAQARGGNLGPLFALGYAEEPGEILVRAATGLRPELAIPVLDQYRSYFRAALLLAVLDRKRALEVVGNTSSEDVAGALDWVPVETVRAADFRGFPDDFRHLAERAVVERLGFPLGVDRARGLEPGRFRGSALLQAAQLPGAPAASLREEAGRELAADPAVSLDDLALAVRELPAADPHARQALAELLARIQGPVMGWWRSSENHVDSALAAAWGGELRGEMLRLPGGRFEVLHANWIAELDAAVQRDLASGDLASLEARYASPAARTVLLYRAALASRDLSVARRIEAPQERAAALLELGDVGGATAAARACPEPLQRVYWLVRVGDAARDPRLHREALEEMFVDLRGERPESLRWGSRVLLGESLYDRANALQVAFTRVFDSRPADRAALAARLGRLDLYSYHVMPLYRYMAGREPRLLPAILREFPKDSRPWLVDEFVAALLPQHPAEASALASSLPPGEDRDVMHAMVAVSLGRQGQWERSVRYLSQHVPSKWTRSQALRYMALQVAPRDPARARALAAAIPMTDARKLTLRDLAKPAE